MKAAWHGHSAVSIETNNGTHLLIDPFITGNELSDLDAEAVEADVILLTHAHADHVGDTVQIAKRNDSLVIANVELADYLATQGLRTHGMQMGGKREFDFGTVKMTRAIHGSSLEIDGKPFTLGLAAGFLFTADGKTLFHAGDTSLFSDLSLIGRLHDIELAFIPIGDNFTMGPEDAVLAAEWLKAKQVVPVHYNTFELIKQDPEKFIQQLPEGVGVVPEIGEPIRL
ncbi:metal-dependent hydrolase [Atopococcus tabaci]|uniref:metal-dependent hydrolase n=1 Tax=Atopococcus tabaci TaxID=269774 RepID=UPI0003F74D1F|nr:metal-dependent hydrolase [Atopococcus tabaci]